MISRLLSVIVVAGILLIVGWASGGIEFPWPFA